MTTVFPDSLRVLLARLIDFAGLFPPAGLGMQESVQNFAEYHAGPEAWALGRFIVPSARLDEFEGCAVALLPTEQGEDPWLLSVLSGEDPAHDAELIFRFNERHAHHAAGRAVIDTIEGRADSPESVERLLRSTPAGVSTYVELAGGDQLEANMRVVADHGGRAKIRTGAVVAEGIPSTATVADFIRTAVRLGVPFKATAGLHHPLRGEYPLTYEVGSPAGTMFGYLNIFLAATLAAQNERTDIDAVLETRTIDAFQFATDGIRWRDEFVSTADVESMRLRVATAFGSCSFTEPLEDLRALGFS